MYIILRIGITCTYYVYTELRVTQHIIIIIIIIMYYTTICFGYFFPGPLVLTFYTDSLISAPDVRYNVHELTRSSSSIKRTGTSLFITIRVGITHIIIPYAPCHFSSDFIFSTISAADRFSFQYIE